MRHGIRHRIRHHARRFGFVVAMLALGAATGCERCQDETTEYDAIFADALYDATLAIVDLARSNGASCDEAPIREGGTQVGVKYTCTQCR